MPKDFTWLSDKILVDSDENSNVCKLNWQLKLVLVFLKIDCFSILLGSACDGFDK